MKSEIYERSQRGELWDGEEQGGFMVDFEEKKWEERFVFEKKRVNIHWESGKGPIYCSFLLVPSSLGPKMCLN